MTRDQFLQKYGREPSSAPAPTQQSQPQDFTEAIGGGLDAVFGGKQIGESLVKAGRNIGNLATGGLDKFNAGLPENTVDVPALIGDYTKAASNFIPGAAKGAGLATRTAVGGATGYAMDVGNNLKNGQKDPFMPGLGTALGAGIPIAGAVLSPAAKVVSSLLKGTGSALSGASQRTIEGIGENPEAAATARNMIEGSPEGEQELIKQNAQTIVKGIQNARRQARSIFGDALEGLSKEDIRPDVFRNETQNFLDKYGVSLESGNNVRNFDNVEFSDPKNLQKASDLVDKLSNTELDGKSLRKLYDDIEAKKYTTTATDAERLSFNAFAQDMANTVKKAINNSTAKLADMNAKYTSDMSTLDAAENIFGHVKYGNLEEVQNTARRLENLFKQKGIDPTMTDTFLQRIGVDPSAFRASEAARQIGNIEPPANAPGINPLEMVRAVTSSIVSPKLIRDLTIATGVAGEKLQPFLEALSTPARNAVIQTLLQQQSGQSDMQQSADPTGAGNLQQMQ